MDKYEYIVNLAEKTAKRVSQNRESWMKFLTSAARIYKYPFKEQLLIYAQNPDATACASIEIWNKRMNCWVNKGSSGIALPDDTATYGHKLKYVFDVSNVHAVKPNGRYPKAWKLREEHKSDVLHRLEQIYGSTDSTKPFEERIIEISDQLAADAYTELQIDYPDLQDRIGFDKLSEQDFALCLKKLISESVSFTILSACEIEISDHEFSFDYINQFVSIKTLSVLGTKINDSARGVLAEIGKTVRIYDKLREKEQEKEISKKELANAPQPRYNALKRESLQEGNSKDKDNIEGGKQNGPGIRTDGRLSDSETESKSGTGGNGNEIRTSEGQISEGEIRWGENSNVSGRNAESTSSRDSGTGKREDGSPDIPDGGERRSKRTAQSTGSDALGEEDEQHPEPGGGSRTERTDLQPTNFVKPEESYTQLSLFPSAEEQRGSITAAEASKKYTMPAAFYLPETDLEVIIRSGGGQKDSRKRIYAKYTEGKSTDEIIAFLKKEYSQVGKGFELHGHPISVWFDENGMTAGYGMQAAESVVTTLSWDQIEKYIHAMITYGLYMDANEAALVDKTEMERVSYQIGYFLRDWIDDVPEELNSIEKIETLLSTHEGREQLESFLEDVDARISYGELKPKTVKSPGYLLSEIADLDRERIHFPLHDTVDVRQEDFITQDEIDYALCIGSGFADGKFRIYEYFMDLHNQKENADFLKKEYGIGGQSGALPGNSSSNSEHDAKGILLEKGSLLNPYTKVLLNWNVVEERICELIYADKYFSPQEKEEYKNYKKEQEKKAKEAEITRLNNGIRLECKQEIEKQIAEKYNGFSVPQNTVSEIVEKYGIDCVQFVLANTIVQAWKEGRFSLRNKEWASSILTEGEWSNTLILNTHPTILDGFTNQVRNQLVSPYQDNMLRITNDGRKLALDQRLINEMLPADENSKVAVCAEKSYHIWEETTSERSTQLIFCDLSTPRKNRDESFSVYDELKSLLMKKGVPEDEIAFIHDANTDQKKAELFAKVRSGQVRFLIGSTSKMGAGTNVQDRLIALHHLDVPWRPSDIEQQEGRILRQGNRNRKVKIFRYVTEGTFDAYSWQLIENKQKFISQIMTSKSPVRSCEDVDESALSYAEVKALATGNPYIKEKMDLDIQVSRLRLLKANYTSQKYRMEDNIVQHYPRQIVMVKELIEKLEQDIALYEQNAATSKDKFHMQVGSGVYDTRKDAGNAIIKFFQTDADGTAKIGTYLGFSMNIAFDSFNRKFVLRLKGAMNHPVEIGPDPVGNIIRLDNVLKTMPDKLAEAKDRLETLTNQLESAKIEVTKPFQQEEELAEKLKRLAELNALLNMDEKGTDALILEDDEQPAIVNSDMAVTPITSVKTKPMLKKKVVGLCL